MTAVKQDAGKVTTGKRLPVVTVGKFDALAVMTEQLFEAQRSQFLDSMRQYSDETREASRRPLTAEEAVIAATTMRNVLGDQADSPADMQASDLYAWDRPGSRELLASAGLGTVPALIGALKRFVAVIEMPNTMFVDAWDDDRLDEALEPLVKKFDGLDLKVARERTVAALGHFSDAAGAGGAGEAVRPLIDTVMRAWEEAASRVTADNLPVSQASS